MTPRGSNIYSPVGAKKPTPKGSHKFKCVFVVVGHANPRSMLEKKYLNQRASFGWYVMLMAVGHAELVEAWQPPFKQETQTNPHCGHQGMNRHHRYRSSIPAFSAAWSFQRSFSFTAPLSNADFAFFSRGSSNVLRSLIN